MRSLYLYSPMPKEDFLQMILEFRPFGKLKEEALTLSEGGTLITLGCSRTTRQDQLGLLKTWISWTSSVKIFLTGCLKS